MQEQSTGATPTNHISRSSNTVHSTPLHYTTHHHYQLRSSYLHVRLSLGTKLCATCTDRVLESLPSRALFVTALTGFSSFIWSLHVILWWSPKHLEQACSKRQFWDTHLLSFHAKQAPFRGRFLRDSPGLILASSLELTLVSLKRTTGTALCGCSAHSSGV